MLRYLADDPQISSELSATKPPQLLFNFLGRTEHLVSSNSMFQFDRPLRLSCDGRNHRPFLLEVNAMIRDEQLIFEWTFSRHYHQPATIETVAKQLLNNLRSLIDHCLDDRTEGVDTEDFPLANLDKTQLGKLAKLLQKSDEPSG